MVNKSVNLWTCQNVPQAPKHILLDLKSGKSGNQVPNLELFEESLKFAHKTSVHNGSYAFPNELMRFRI